MGTYTIKVKNLILLIMIPISIWVYSRLFDTVIVGTYHVVILPDGGYIRDDPGSYLQNFHDVYVWPKSESVKGQTKLSFNDGASCLIYWDVRVDLPFSPQNRLDLVTKYNFHSAKDLNQELIVPTVSDILRRVANRMSLKGYYLNRNQFVESVGGIFGSGTYKVRAGLDGEISLNKYRLHELGIRLYAFNLYSSSFDEPLDDFKKSLSRLRLEKLRMSETKGSLERLNLEKLVEQKNHELDLIRIKYGKELRKIAGKALLEDSTVQPLRH